MANYKLTLCYDGTRYRGWQKQGNTESTVQGKLEEMLWRILGEEVEVHGCGRTDGGVHARMQVCSFRCSRLLDVNIMLTELRKYSPDDIGIISIEQAPERFHARLSCKEKSYLYRIHNSDSPNVFERKYVYTVTEPLNIDAMRKAAGYLIGERDFSAFCSLKNSKKSMIRYLKSIDIHTRDDDVYIMLTGSGFLYHMVRIIAGTLIQVGTGERRPDDMPAILASGDRQNAGPTAPAHGLTLWDIQY